MAVENNEALGWDDEIEEGSEFKLLPDGDYKFLVTGFERAFHENKGGKIPDCNEGDIEFTIVWSDEDGNHTNKLTHRLYLVRTQQWKIYQFFESIGLRKKGEGKTKMPWDKVLGSEGVCQIGHHEYQGKTRNDIIKCYPTEDAPTVYENMDTSEESAFEL